MIITCRVVEVIAGDKPNAEVQSILVRGDDVFTVFLLVNRCGAYATGEQG